jgi:hypothetical protein
MTTPEDRDLWERDEEALRDEVRQLNATLDRAGRDAITAARAYRALVAERDLLAQAMWDARGALGFDNDGDESPAASIHGDFEQFAANHVREAREQARDYETALDLWDGTERREWVARAEAAEAKVARVEALRGKGSPVTMFGIWGTWVEDSEWGAALADAPAEQRAEDAGDCSNVEHVCSCATDTYVHAADCNMWLNGNPAEGDGRG